MSLPSGNWRSYLQSPPKCDALLRNVPLHSVSLSLSVATGTLTYYAHCKIQYRHYLKTVSCRWWWNKEDQSTPAAVHAPTKFSISIVRCHLEFCEYVQSSFPSFPIRYHLINTLKETKRTVRTMQRVSIAKWALNRTSSGWSKLGITPGGAVAAPMSSIVADIFERRATRTNSVPE